MNDNSVPTNPARRRLAKGGLAVPVVLASLTSKNAFADALPYHCFVSGKLSNNMSPFGPNAQTANDVCKLPQSRSEVQTGLQRNEVTFQAVFNIAIYVNTKPDTPEDPNPDFGLLTTNANGGKDRRAATLYDVLTASSVSNGNAVPKLDMLQRAVVLYQNAAYFPPPNALVPLSTAQVVAMTQAAYNGGSYTVKTSIGDRTFSAGEIQSYFIELSA